MPALRGIGDPYRKGTEYTVHGWPDSYVPRKPSRIELVLERILEHPRTFAIVGGVFAGLLLTWLTKWALAQAWAMRIGI